MDEQRLTDTQAKKLLERASELDAEHTHSLDVATVRAIASEAGISPAAVDAALMEQAMEQATARATAQPTAVAGGNAKRRLLVVSRVVLGVAIAYLLASIVLRLFP